LTRLDRLLRIVADVGLARDAGAEPVSQDATTVGPDHALRSEAARSERIGARRRIAYRIGAAPVSGLGITFLLKGYDAVSAHQAAGSERRAGVRNAHRLRAHPVAGAIGIGAEMADSVVAARALGLRAGIGLAAGVVALVDVGAGGRVRDRAAPVLRAAGAGGRSAWIGLAAGAGALVGAGAAGATDSVIDEAASIGITAGADFPLRAVDVVTGLSRSVDVLAELRALDSREQLAAATASGTTCSPDLAVARHRIALRSGAEEELRTGNLLAPLSRVDVAHAVEGAACSPSFRTRIWHAAGSRTLPLALF